MDNAGAAEALRRLIAEGLADPQATWSLGGFGALAEFGRLAGEPVTALTGDRVGLITARGGIALDAARAVPVAYETAFTGGWSHAVALCLPRGSCCPALSGVVIETGPDVGALRPENSGDNLFDLGLGLPQARVGLRTGAPDRLATLRAIRGRSACEAESPVLDLVAGRRVDVVVSGPLGRIEVFAGPSGPAPGPRAYLVPRLLALGRTHAATAPIPEGLIPVATLHPAHPCRDADRQPRPFDVARHTAFQRLLARWGDPELVALKERLRGGEPAELAATRRTRAVARVVREQAEVIASNHDDGKSCRDTPR